MNLDKLIKVSEVETVMGVDASSTSIAFSYFKGNNLLRWGKVYVDGENNYEKSADAYSKFYALCGSLSPDLVVIESSVYVNNNKVMRQLSMMMGALSAAAVNKGCRVAEVPPITWQSYIGNKNFTKEEKSKMKKDNPDATDSAFKSIMRRERKERTIQFVDKSFGVKVEDDDVADAISVGFYGVNFFAGEK